MEAFQAGGEWVWERTLGIYLLQLIDMTKTYITHYRKGKTKKRKQGLFKTNFV